MSNLYRNHFDGTEDADAYLDIYTLHLFAMTTEALHSKAEITHELAYRDYQIQLLKGMLSDAELSPDDNSDTVQMPRELTAEQGFKYALIGEFSEPYESICPHCDAGLINTQYDDIDDETCPECEGEYIRIIKQDISWNNIKAIYKAAVAHFHPVSDARGDSE